MPCLASPSRASSRVRATGVMAGGGPSHRASTTGGGT
eukprot:CAMPEP_0172039596 /NCGR_PEP_ID=MMETSP1041-20130122/23990_1 /TAXON_ID=464988 /ORGANISM="Hemiselmis andersenii, Strain CCMP439" /LENGTH=36 /DNA_ID= /DNA_START= /DNA_END= /DNA_ORIENTATION=